jgi:tetratricopeptide (TPR) repeat protein
MFLSCGPLKCRIHVALLLVMVSVTAAGSARAADPAPDDKTTQARNLAQEATTHYAVGEFAQSAEKYQAAYKLKPDPALLYNAAQAYRMAGNNDKALLLYKNYVMFYPNEKNVPNVQQQITKLQEAIAAQHKAQTQPPTTTEPPSTGAVAPPAPSAIAAAPPAATAPPATEPPASPPPAAEPPPPAAPPAASLVAAPPPATSADQPIYKKWWLWTAVGVVVLGGVITAIALSSGSSSPWNTAPDLGPGAGLR